MLRASLIAINNNKQVVNTVPTTIPANQHYETFKKRFIDYNIQIDLITRAVSESRRLQIFHSIKNNISKIIIGTHALLNKDIGYTGLGLLIIDEEHKFGVKHKELIKSMKSNIDVLTLTATPHTQKLPNATLSEIKDNEHNKYSSYRRRKNIETKYH